MREKIFCIYGCFNASRYRCQRRQRLYTSLDTIEFLDTCVCIKTHIDKVLLYKWLTAPFLSFMKPSEFGKKTNIKNAITYENYDGKTDQNGKNMPLCIRLTTAKLDWLIGKTSMCIATQKQERCLRRKYVIYSIFKNQMYDVMNVL